MSDREKAILWLNSFMKNTTDSMVLIPKPLVKLMYDVLTEEEENKSKNIVLNIHLEYDDIVERLKKEGWTCPKEENNEQL